MIKKEVQKAIEEIISKDSLKEKRTFIVDLNITNNNSINLMLDSYSGISVSDCSLVSRKFSEYFDRDLVDYDLIVSSAGLTNDFKVKEQYYKAIGKDIKILKTDGKHAKGKLLKVEENGVEIEAYSKKQKKHKKETIIFEDIKSAKLVISF